MKNKTKFAEFMAALGEIFDKDISKTLSLVYWKTLEPYPDKECEKAFNSIITTAKFWPKPAELLEALNGTDEEAAINAWTKVSMAVRTIGPYKPVQFDDSAIHSALEAMGGWVEFQNCSMNDWKWKQKEFERIYLLMTKKDEHPKYLPGITKKISCPNCGQQLGQKELERRQGKCPVCGKIIKPIPITPMRVQSMPCLRRPERLAAKAVKSITVQQ